MLCQKERPAYIYKHRLWLKTVSEYRVITIFISSNTVVNVMKEIIKFLLKFLLNDSCSN